MLMPAGIGSSKSGMSPFVMGAAIGVVQLTSHAQLSITAALRDELTQGEVTGQAAK